MNNHICIIDNDTSILDTLERVLIKNGYTVSLYSSAEAFLAYLESNEPAVAVIDINLGEGQMHGGELTKKIRENFATIQTVIISGESDISKTLECMKNGAYDFIEKPLSLPKLLTTIKNAVNQYCTKTAFQTGREILGTSSAITTLKNRLKKLASLNENVLICGESGTGKELVAENLHYYSNRFHMPFYKVNCTAINPQLVESELFGHTKGSFTGAVQDKKGLFELAHGGSFFMDEIGDFDIQLQSKLLRVIQEKKVTAIGQSQEIGVDTRMIFATHCDLNRMVQEQRFRSDLFFRISTFIIDVPPLRKRLEDIPLLSDHIVRTFIAENNLHYTELESSALDKLMSYTYPGNIRELISIVKNAIIFSSGEQISAEDISFTPVESGKNMWDLVSGKSYNDAKMWFEKELVSQRLKQFDNDLDATAVSLGMIKNNLYRKIKAHNIHLK
ncbi:MAG: sigma-54 dependent transcriptional regulator [Fibrobacterales bacterium]